VAVVSNKAQDRSLHTDTIAEIKNLVKQDRICTFVKVDRRQVRAGHCLANFARTEQQSLLWFGSGSLLQDLEHELNVPPTA
jgi:hypothetical protein